MRDKEGERQRKQVGESLSAHAAPLPLCFHALAQLGASDVLERERETERVGERGREREREIKCVRETKKEKERVHHLPQTVCVCVCVNAARGARAAHSALRVGGASQPASQPGAQSPHLSCAGRRRTSLRSRSNETAGSRRPRHLTKAACALRSPRQRR